MSKAQNGYGPRAADLKFAKEGFGLLLKLGKRRRRSVRVRAGQNGASRTVGEQFG
jgi:hypothetical protein